MSIRYPGSDRIQRQQLVWTGGQQLQQVVLLLLGVEPESVLLAPQIAGIRSCKGRNSSLAGVVMMVALSRTSPSGLCHRSPRA